jgi:hypothetical protein
MLKDWLIAALEKEPKMTQAALARELTVMLNRSIDRAAVNKMTKGERGVSADEMLAIMKLRNADPPKPLEDYIRAKIAERVRAAISEARKHMVPEDDVRNALMLVLADTAGKSDTVAREAADYILEEIRNLRSPAPDLRAAELRGAFRHIVQQPVQKNDK